MTARVVATGLDVPEGPLVLPDGDVLVVEIKGGRLTRIDPTTGRTAVVASLGGGPNGAALGPDGLVYVCNNGGSQWHHVEGALFLPAPRDPLQGAHGFLQRVDPDTGRVELLLDSCDGQRLNSPNDLVFDAQGGLYFTDFGRSVGNATERGSVHYLSPGGDQVTRVASGLDRPNGCGLSPSGDRFYVSETFTGRIWWWHVERLGELRGGGTYRGSGGGNLLYGAGGYHLFDSLALERDGNLCVATYYDLGITVISPEGEFVELVEIDDRLVTNLAFGGPECATAYVTAAGGGALLEVPWPREGLRPLA